MFTSLRSRLSMTSILLIGIILFTASTMMILFVRNIPVRNASIRLQEVGRLVLQDFDHVGMRSPHRSESLQGIAERYNVRILVTESSGVVVYDSGTGFFPPMRQGLSRNGDASRGPVRSIRDSERGPWLVSINELNDQFNLVLATPRPGFQWLNIFRDDLLPLLLWAAGLAMLLAIMLSALTARWVSRPLANIADATRNISGGEYQRIEEAGPQEVQQLARAFNEMVTQVEAGQKSQRDFVANVSHELKTPLTAIQGFSQAIQDRTASTPEEISNAAAVIHDEADRMHRLVLDLLELARIEGGALAFQNEPVDLAEIVSAVIEKLTLQASKKQIEISLRTSPIVQIAGDGERLRQVFSNLLENAIKNSPVGGEILVQISGDAAHAVVSFSDSGPGVPPEEQARIFERFYQLDKSRGHMPERGFGLGLAIAKEIVEAHHGRIILENNAPHGSVFVVKLPFAHRG